MPRLCMTVEGQTEQAFAAQVLTPHLARSGVMLAKPRLTGPISRRKGRIPRGGMLGTFAHALGDMKRWLKEDREENVRFTMMVDLYGLPSDFPAYGSAMDERDPYRRADVLEAALAEEIKDERFIPYLQVHEFEALVLAQPEAFARLFENSERATNKLTRVCRDYDTPEKIDDGQDTHPKARIRSLFPDYDENVDGPLLAHDIGLDVIRNACPHFHRWLTALEELGQFVT
jgi:hypothetical protein